METDAAARITQKIASARARVQALERRRITSANENLLITPFSSGLILTAQNPALATADNSARTYTLTFINNGTTFHDVYLWQDFAQTIVWDTFIGLPNGGASWSVNFPGYLLSGESFQLYYSVDHPTSPPPPLGKNPGGANQTVVINT